MPDKKLKDIIDSQTLKDYGISPGKIEDLTVSDMSDIHQALMEVNRKKMIEGSGGGCTSMCTTAMCTC